MRGIFLAFLLIGAGCASLPPAKTAGMPSGSIQGCFDPVPCKGPSPCISTNPECDIYNPPPPHVPCTTCACEEGLFCMATCGPLPAETGRFWPTCGTQTSTPCGLTVRPPSSETVHFAVIGDWGDTVCAQTCAATVARMVKAWDAAYGIDFIITTGDNNYPVGAPTDLVQEMALYAKWAPWPSGSGPGHCPPQPGDPPLQVPPRFFPTLGNHDYTPDPDSSPQPYLDYFCQLGANSQTGTARYYTWAPNDLIEIFSINAASSEPSGNSMDSKQQQWITNAMLTSTATWKIVTFHEPPQITTSYQDRASDNSLLWTFGDWGAAIVLMGHQHLYERVELGGLTWVVNGLGGTTGIASVRDDQGCTKAPGSQRRFNQSVGAMIGVATRDELRFCFLAATRDNPEGQCIDSFIARPPRRNVARLE
jgi:hypothetical protein